MKTLNTLSISLLFSFLLILGSCTLFTHDGLPHATYEGFYTWGFETNSFEPCQISDEDWLVVTGKISVMDSLILKYKSLSDQRYTEIYVQLEGTPSEKGEYGHMGGSDRKFELDKVVEIRQPRSSDCK